MATKRKNPIEHPPRCRGRKCRSCTWDSVHITVDGPHARYTKGHRTLTISQRPGISDSGVLWLSTPTKRQANLYNVDAS
jgi:hypothetical protein